MSNERLRVVRAQARLQAAALTWHYLVDGPAGGCGRQAIEDLHTVSDLSGILVGMTSHTTTVTGEPHINRYTGGDATTRYLAACECGWSDGYFADRAGADQRAAEHRDVATLDDEVVAGPIVFGQLPG